MGILDRLHSLVTATGGALEAPLGFVKDTALALPELGTLDLPSFTHDVYHAFIDSAAKETASLIGPQGIGGSIAGSVEDIPGVGPALGAGVGATINPVQNGMNLAYHELVGQPLSTAVTAATFAKQDGLDALVKPQTYSEAWNIADHRSPGQSLALAFLTHDIRDPAQVRKAQGTDWYHAISGVTDAVARIYLDPTALALGEATDIAQGARGIEDTSHLFGLVHTGGVDALTQSGAVGSFVDRIGAIQAEHGDGAAAIIRHELFPNHQFGAEISDLLANAAKLPPAAYDGLDGAGATERVLRVLMGQTDEIATIRSTRPDLAGQLERLSERRDMLKALSPNGFALANSDEDLANLNREINVLHNQQDRLDRLDAMQATIERLPRPEGAQTLRGRFTQGDFYQSSPWSKPLRVMFNMEPHQWIRLDDANSDISVARMLAKSDLPQDEQLAWRSHYMEQTDPATRALVAHAAETAAVSSIAKTAGMTDDQLEIALREAWKNKRVTQDLIDSRAYDGEGRSKIQFDDENGHLTNIHMMEAPLYETQLPNLTKLVDLDQVRAVISPIKSFLARNPGYQLADAAIDNFAAVWKPAVLLRVGFPLRYLTDETLRSMSKIGTLATLKNIGRGGVDGVGNAIESIGTKLDRFRDPAVLAEKADQPIDLQGVNIAGHEFEGAFGAPGDGSNIYRKLITARESFGTLISEREGRLMDQLIQSGQWRSINPTEAAYPQAWEHAVNKQIAQSDLGSHLLEKMQPPTKTQMAEGVLPRTRDEIVAETVDWLKNHPAGKAVADKLPIRRDLDQWVQAAHDQIDSYLPTPALRASAWNQTATHGDLVNEIPNAAERPIVHGGVVTEAMGGPIGETYRKMVDFAMRNLVAKPSDVLIRQPFFDHMYQAELARQVRLATGAEQLSLPDRIAAMFRGESTHAVGDTTAITADDMQRMQVTARRYALGQTKALFHDFSEQFSFAKQLGFLSPFANAWGQIMSRWAGVAVDNPAFIRRLQIAWRAPERMGIVTDGKGNVIDEHGRIVTPVANSQYKVGDPAGDGQRNVTIPLPTWAKDIPVVGPGLAQSGDLRFGKDSINMILHGLPPVGPIVQVAMNEIAKARPDLESSLKWALPFGAQQNSLDILKPTLVRRLQTSSEGDADRSFAYSAMRIWSDKMVDYNLGKRAKAPTWAEAEKDAQAFWHMRTIASFGLPVTPQFTSPYQSYIDAYRARKDLDASLTPQQKALPSYKTPDEWFLDTYGQEFFPLVASMSKSIDGIPPTLAGQKLHQQFAKIIENYPELGGLISGADGAGAFSRAVYEAQFGQKVGPDVSQNERQVQPFEQYRTEASTSLGWIEFGRAMDTLDAVLHQRGLASYAVAGAADLQRAKQALVQYLATSPKYEGWYQDYVSTDGAKWDKRIAGMTAIASNPALAARPEIAGLRVYLEARKAFVGALQALGRKALDTTATSALEVGWQAYIHSIVERNPAFGSLYNRWLQNDPVTITPITNVAQSGSLPTISGTLA